MTNNKQQTAVEWLVEQFENHRATFFKLNDKEERVITLAGRDVVEQAKEMEKEQHLKTWGNGWVNGDISVDNYESVAENYYNETYGGNK
jgi:hypothetical protein